MSLHSRSCSRSMEDNHPSRAARGRPTRLTADLGGRDALQRPKRKRKMPSQESSSWSNIIFQRSFEYDLALKSAYFEQVESRPYRAHGLH